ncbi:Glutamate-1-semialdehyde 2,1-aminomutase [Sulfuracidifex tepidarius]|uniref:Glutamate-1-semialdehyde 2,1-aminomutase n=1 Tax=Sulfuracidifex tepidarius TaxID=1294262 RepID=A0A510DXZ7_9CREN|nr:aspartate aminotransferase family protein [Sulfuracidifex tepidarius]BBG25067.1 Glutamate-1-semialdehyde 2,1-aminomutase [Sulfuracidifex tepidarius]
MDLKSYSEATVGSLNLFNENKKVMPYGVSSNYRFFEPYPLYIKKGKGSRVWDVDGNEYVDYNLGFGVMEVGYGNERIVREVSKVIEEGTILGFEYYRTGELAREISRRYGAEMVRFSSTGTEATMHSIRIARAFTGRKKVVKFEGHYHGSHDQLLVNVNPPNPKGKTMSSLGIPEETVVNTIVVDWNDIDEVEKVMKEDVAAVIMEPVAMNMGLIPTKEDFLREVVKMSKEVGAVVIFDETKTGGKAYSGASGEFGIKPDLMILGKSITGGFPLSVIGGKREVMEVIGPGKTAHGGTYNANPVSVVSSLVTLKEILTEDAFYHMRRLNRMLVKGYEEIGEDVGIDVSISSWGTSGTVFFSDEVPENYKEFIATDVRRWFSYFFACLEEGVIPMGGFNEQWTLSVSHSEEDVKRHLEAAEAGLKKAKEGGMNFSTDESF